VATKKKKKVARKTKKKIPTIYIGMSVINEMLAKIGMPKGEVGDIIGLSVGGFHKVTHVSGRMNIECWEKFKKLYFSKGYDKLPEDKRPHSDRAKNSKVNSARREIKLQTCSLEELVDEIENRGYEVMLKRIKE